MKSKKKLIVALSIAGVVLLAAIISVVAVLAAGTQNVSSGVTVKYSVTDVAATVGAKYKVGSNAAVASNPATVAFGAAETETTKSLAFADEISLSSTTTYVTFEYMFENDAAKSFKVYLKGMPAVDNMNVTYATSTTAVEDMSSGLSFATLQTVATANATNNIASVGENIDDKVYIYIKAEIADVTKGASFIGDFDWQLDSTL